MTNIVYNKLLFNNLKEAKTHNGLVIDLDTVTMTDIVQYLFHLENEINKLEVYNDQQEYNRWIERMGDDL